MSRPWRSYSQQIKTKPFDFLHGFDFPRSEVQVARTKEEGLLADLKIGQGKPQSNHVLAVQNTGKRKNKGLVNHKHSKRPRNQDKKPIKKGTRKSTHKAARNPSIDCLKEVLDPEYKMKIRTPSFLPLSTLFWWRLDLSNLSNLVALAW